MRRKERRAAGQVEDQVAARHGTVARPLELEEPARRRVRRRIAVDDDLEPAEMALRSGDRAGEDRHLRQARRDDVDGPVEEQGAVEAAGELLRRGDRDVVAAVDERRAGGFQRDGRRRRNVERRLGQQGGDLRQRLIAFFRPAGALADIGEMQVDIAAECRARLGEERRFLRARDEQRLLSGARGLERADLRPAQRGADASGAHPARLRKRVAVDAHRPVAIADEDGLAVQFQVLLCLREGLVVSNCPKARKAFLGTSSQADRAAARNGEHWLTGARGTRRKPPASL